MKRFFIIIFCLLSIAGLRAQIEGVSINSTGADPDASAMLDVQSTDKGMLVPRVTTAQRLAIPSPATSLLVFDSDDNGFWFFNGSTWQALSSTSTDQQSLAVDWDSLSITNGAGVDLDTLEHRLFSDRMPGSVVPDVIQNLGGNYTNILSSGWQSWTATQEAFLSEVHYNVNAAIPFDGGYASIFAGEGVNPGSLLGTIQIGSNSGGWDIISFDELNIELETGQKYTVQITDSVNTFAWDIYGTNVYPGGMSDQAISADYAFRVYVRPYTIRSLISVDSVVAGAFIGDGSGLTNVPGDDLGNHTATQALDLDGNNINNGGTVTAFSFVGDGSGLTNLPIGGSQSLGLTVDSLTITNGTGLALTDLESNLFRGEIPFTDVAQESFSTTSIGPNQWQSWTANQDAILSEFQFEVDYVEPFNGGYAQLYLGQGPAPANLLETVPIESQSAGWNTLSFEGLNFELSAGQIYTVAITDTLNAFSWRTSLVNPYAGGIANTVFQTDLVFRVIVRERHPGSIFLDSVVASVFIGDGSGLKNIPDNDNQTLALSNGDLSISAGNTIDISSINTDGQTLALSNGDLSISGGNTIDISGINTDDQTLSLSGTTLSISGGNSISLFSANNGLNFNSNANRFQLGGSLNQNTTINQGSFELNFTTNQQDGFSVDGNTFSVNGSANRVGIGTTSPFARLHVAGDIIAPNGVFAVETNSTNLSTASVVSHIWHDNADNAWHMVSNDGYKETGDTELYVGEVHMPGNIVYTENWGNLVNLNHDVWQNVSGYTQWMAVESGNVLKGDFNLSVRLEAGAGTDDFLFRLNVDANGGCSDFNGEELLFRPDEQGINHDNWTPVHYMDILPISCDGEVRFRIQVQNTGDDEFEVRDRSLVVTKY